MFFPSSRSSPTQQSSENDSAQSIGTNDDRSDSGSSTSTWELLDDLEGMLNDLETTSLVNDNDLQRNERSNSTDREIPVASQTEIRDSALDCFNTEKVQEVDTGTTDSESDICVINEGDDIQLTEEETVQEEIEETFQQDIQPLSVNQRALTPTTARTFPSYNFLFVSSLLLFVFTSLICDYLTPSNLQYLICKKNSIVHDSTIELLAKIKQSEVIDVAVLCSRKNKESQFDETEFRKCMELHMQLKIIREKLENLKGIRLENNKNRQPESTASFFPLNNIEDNNFNNKGKNENRSQTNDFYTKKVWKNDSKKDSKKKFTKNNNEYNNDKKKDPKNCKDRDDVCKSKNSKEKRKKYYDGGEWYTNLHQMRNDVRKSEHKSDWLFERARNRKVKRSRSD